ncbi:hypothetical protein OKJ48_29175 [Streptomyces kunmingensis]|uniref:Uncharacterized protein n=1 Tax=Streptomyces kunmingensis TaxID=68225 RepID=A0ABU6CHV6_9ACTN|nr:hypothetical protein [Streptomyces kunmingensis]MEB3964282.1 hypothetical protein [Streptomyces kunmingensis]
MNPGELVPFATAMGTLTAAGVAGLVAWRAALRSARITWRSKTVEWQFEAVTQFYDAVMYFSEPRTRVRDIDEREDTRAKAWRRLYLAGPGALVALEGAAHTMSEAARGVADGIRGLNIWYDLLDRACRACEHLSELVDQDERRGNPDGSLHDEYDLSKTAHGRLQDALRPGLAVDWYAVNRAVDAYASRVTADSDGTPGDAVTSEEVNRALESVGPPYALHGELDEAWRDLLGAAPFFSEQVRGWLDGRVRRVPQAKFRRSNKYLRVQSGAVDAIRTGARPRPKQ